LIDLDGVLCVGSQVIAGAGEALRQLADDAVPVRFLTNTTTKTAAEVASKLDRLGFDINPGDILSAVTATREYLIHHAPDGTQPSLHLLVRQSVMAEFAGFPHASLETGEGAPDYVVVGDIGAAWSYPLLNTVFNELMQGATLVAMHRNKFWQTEEGLRMDIAAQSTIRPDAELASVADLPQWVQQPHPSGN
jgi:HAD superfamily hydrolase (TIGR01450 family)